MSKLPERIEQLEGRIKPKPSPWIQKAAESLTDEDLENVQGFFKLSIWRKQAEATPAQWAAIKTLCRTEARLKEEAVRNGERVGNAPLLIEIFKLMRISLK